MCFLGILLLSEDYVLISLSYGTALFLKAVCVSRSGHQTNGMTAIHSRCSRHTVD